MRYRLFLIVAAALPVSCGNPPTPSQQTQLIGAAGTLLSVAAQNNTTVAGLVAKGALFCQYVNPLSRGVVVSLANSAGLPISVTNQSAADVAAACDAISAVPVSPPTTPEAVTVVPIKNLALPAVPIS